MKANIKIENCKVYDTIENKSDDGKIVWWTLAFRQGNDMSSVTVDKEVAKTIKPSGMYNLLATCSENKGVNKIKVVGVEPLNK